MYGLRVYTQDTKVLQISEDYANLALVKSGYVKDLGTASVNDSPAISIINEYDGDYAYRSGTIYKGDINIPNCLVAVLLEQGTCCSVFATKTTNTATEFYIYAGGIATGTSNERGATATMRYFIFAETKYAPKSLSRYGLQVINPKTGVLNFDSRYKYMKVDTIFNAVINAWESNNELDIQSLNVGLKVYAISSSSSNIEYGMYYQGDGGSGSDDGTMGGSNGTLVTYTVIDGYNIQNSMISRYAAKHEYRTASNSGVNAGNMRSLCGAPLLIDVTNY